MPSGIAGQSSSRRSGLAAEDRATARALRATISPCGVSGSPGSRMRTVGIARVHRHRPAAKAAAGSRSGGRPVSTKTILTRSRPRQAWGQKGRLGSDGPERRGAIAEQPVSGLFRAPVRPGPGRTFWLRLRGGPRRHWRPRRRPLDVFGQRPGGSGAATSQSRIPDIAELVLSDPSPSVLRSSSGIGTFDGRATTSNCLAKTLGRVGDSAVELRFELRFNRRQIPFSVRFAQDLPGGHGENQARLVRIRHRTVPLFAAGRCRDRPGPQSRNINAS